MSSYKPVTHVIFDVDGLLLDTERLYTIAIQSLASEYGKQYTWETKVKCMGAKGDVGARIVIEDLQLPITVDEYFEKVFQKQKELFPNAALLPGAEKLVRHLHKCGIPIAIASGSHDHTYKLKITKHQEFFSLFNHCVLSSSNPEVKEGKPAPDVFLICANKFPNSPSPEKCLVFEDAPNGVTAGLAAGMQVVLVPDPRLSEEKRKEATLALNSLEEFKPELFGLPPY